MGNNVLDPFVDTDVIIRFLTNDDPRKQVASEKLFKKVEKGELILSAPDTVIADAVFVLSSKRLYNLPRNQIRDMLITLLRQSNFKVDNKQAVLKALDIFAVTNLDFGDSMIIAVTLKSDEKILYAYDKDYDKIEGIKRKEP